MRAQNGTQRVLSVLASILVLLLPLAGGPGADVARAQDVFDEIESDWAAFSEEIEGDYRAYLAETDAEYLAFIAEVEALWGEFIESTRPVWSSYSGDLHGHSEVDFETGQVKVEVMVEPAAAPGPQLQQRIAAELRRLLSARNPTRKPVLQEQIDTGTDEPLQEEQVVEVVEKIVEEIVAAPEPPVRTVTASNGVERDVYMVNLALVPDHLARRAEPYQELVAEFSREYDLDPAMVLAVIHTESYFNPLARSHVPAYGLMQLVPSSGGLDAYEYVHGVHEKPAVDYLYEPRNNILLGATYLHILLDRHFGKVKDSVKRTYLSIASYNCGPGNVRKAIRKGLGSLDEIGRVATRKIYDVLQEFVPDETKDYLHKVTQRMGLYGGQEKG